MLYAITVEYSYRAVVHLDGDGDADCALWTAEDFDETVFKSHLFCCVIEILQRCVEKYVGGSTFLYGHITIGLLV